jgi:CBS domain-containing protein
MQEGPAIRASDSLRAALSLLLQSGSSSLPVLGEAGRAVGQVSFEDIRQAVLAGRVEIAGSGARRDALPD